MRVDRLAIIGQSGYVSQVLYEWEGVITFYPCVTPEALHNVHRY